VKASKKSLRRGGCPRVRSTNLGVTLYQLQFPL
jgi:hypothetical protein